MDFSVVPVEHMYSARKFSLQNELPVEFVLAIAISESGFDQYAVRYEESLHQQFKQNPTIKAIKPCSQKTEVMLNACSFGPMQVLGNTARFLGFKGTFLVALSDVSLGYEYGCKCLAYWRKVKKLDKNYRAIAAAYNGGGGAVLGPTEFKNPEYVAKINAALGGVWPT